MLIDLRSSFTVKMYVGGNVSRFGKMNTFLVKESNRNLSGRTGKDGGELVLLYGVKQRW